MSLISGLMMVLAVPFMENPLCAAPSAGLSCASSVLRCRLDLDEPGATFGSLSRATASANFLMTVLICLLTQKTQRCRHPQSAPAAVELILAVGSCGPSPVLQCWGSLDMYLSTTCRKSVTDWCQDFISPNFTLFDVQCNEAAARAHFIIFTCYSTGGGSTVMESWKSQN